MTARNNLDDNNNIRKTTRYNSQTVLSGLLVCAECGANYRRITKPSGEVVWHCGNKVEHGKAICKYAPAVSEKAVKKIFCGLFDMTEFDEQIVNTNVETILIQHNDSLDAKYQVELMQIMEHYDYSNQLHRDIIFVNWKKNVLPRIQF